MYAERGLRNALRFTRTDGLTDFSQTYYEYRGAIPMSTVSSDSYLSLQTNACLLPSFSENETTNDPCIIYFGKIEFYKYIECNYLGLPEYIVHYFNAIMSSKLFLRNLRS